MEKNFFSVCVKSNFFYTALSLSKHQVQSILLQTGIFLQLTFPRIAFNTPFHSSEFAALSHYVQILVAQIESCFSMPRKNEYTFYKGMPKLTNYTVT